MLRRNLILSLDEDQVAGKREKRDCFEHAWDVMTGDLPGSGETA